MRRAQPASFAFPLLHAVEVHGYLLINYTFVNSTLTVYLFPITINFYFDKQIVKCVYLVK